MDWWSRMGIWKPKQKGLRGSLKFTKYSIGPNGFILEPHLSVSAQTSSIRLRATWVRCTATHFCFVCVRYVCRHQKSCSLLSDGWLHISNINVLPGSPSRIATYAYETCGRHGMWGPIVRPLMNRLERAACFASPAPTNGPEPCTYVNVDASGGRPGTCN